MPLAVARSDLGKSRIVSTLFALTVRSARVDSAQHVPTEGLESPPGVRPGWLMLQLQRELLLLDRLHCHRLQHCGQPHTGGAHDLRYHRSRVRRRNRDGTIPLQQALLLRFGARLGKCCNHSERTSTATTPQIEVPQDSQVHKANMTGRRQLHI